MKKFSAGVVVAILVLVAALQGLADTPGNSSSNASMISAANQLSSYYSNYFKNYWSNQGALWLNSTSLSFFAGSNWGDYNYQLNTVQPLVKGDVYNLSRLPFVEANVFGGANGTTANVGVGYRMLNDQKNRMIGANLFYDVSSVNNNYNSGIAGYQSASAAPVQQRMGLGLEFMQGYFEGIANYYLPISGRQLMGADYSGLGNNRSLIASYYQEALSGFDIALSSAIPGATWLQANLRGYNYYGNNTAQMTGSNPALQGFTIGANAQLTPMFNLIAGYDTGARNAYVQGTFNLLAQPKSALFYGDPTINAYSQINVSNKLLNQVQRNNTITAVVERQYNVTGSFTTVLIPVLDWQGNPVAGATVTMVSANGQYSFTAVTNAQGIATFSIPTNVSPTGVVNDAPTANAVWNAAIQYWNWDGSGWVQTYSGLTLSVNSSSGVVGPVPQTVVPPQPTQQQREQSTPPVPPNPQQATTVNVHFVDALGNNVAIANTNDIRVVLLDPGAASWASPSNLPSCVITPVNLAEGRFSFQPVVNNAQHYANTQISGTYGIAIKSNIPGGSVVFGNTINVPAYSGQTLAVNVLADTASYANTLPVTITVKDIAGNPVSGATVRVGSSMLDYPGGYQPTSKTTNASGQVTFNPAVDGPIPVGQKFYVLAYNWTNPEQPSRTVVAVGQFDGLPETLIPGQTSYNLTVQAIPQP